MNVCSMESLACLQGAGPLVLDGGLATELEAQGVKLQVRNQGGHLVLTWRGCQ